MAAADINVTLGADAKQYNETMKQAARTAQQTSRAIEQLPRSTVNANYAFQNLNRVVQDAPFGFIAIQNNLQPVIEGFQQLSSQAKESGQSIGKVLVSSLTGAGGLGIAFSLVTTAITFASVGLQYWTRKNGEAKKASVDYVESLEDVREAHVRAAQAAVEETLKLQLLYKFATDANKPLEERKKAVDELQKQYPAYFKNISDEAILLGRAGNAYDNLTTAILKAAQARAASEKISENSKRAITDQEKRLDIATQLTTKIVELDKLEKQSEARTGSTDITAGQSLDIEFKRIAVGREINDLFKEYNDLSTDQTILNKRNLDLINNYYDTATKVSDITGNVSTGDAAPTSTIEGFEALSKQISELELQLQNSLIAGQDIDNRSPLALRIRALREELDMLKTSYEAALSKSPDLEGAIKPFEISANDNGLAGLLQDYPKMVKALQEGIPVVKELSAAGKEAVNTLGQGLTGAFESIVNGTQSAVQAIGTFLKNLIARMIAAAAAAAILAAILSAAGFGPGAGQAVSFANSFKGLFNSFSGFTAFAEGGIVTKPTRALIGEAGEAEAVIPLSKLGKFMGQNNTATIGEFTLRGSDLIMAVTRAQKDKNRRG